MRRLVLKYNEAENLLKLVNDRINENIDKINYGVKKDELERNCENAISRLNDRVKFLENELEKEKISKALTSTENTKLVAENKRLNEVVDKFQNHIIKTHEEEVFLKPKPRLVFVPDSSGIADDKSRIITTIIPPVHSNFSKVVPLSPIRKPTQVSNLTRVSQIRGDK